jgi:hypothetical protein
MLDFCGEHNISGLEVREMWDRILTTRPFEVEVQLRELPFRTVEGEAEGERAPPMTNACLGSGGYRLRAHKYPR